MSVATVSDQSVVAAPSDAGAATRLLPLAGRVLIGAIFLLSGLSKLADPAATMGYIGASGLPALPGYLGALAVELGAGAALVLGFRTRSAAAVLAAFTLVTALVFHHALGDQNQFIHFFKNLAMTGGLLQVVAFGPGALSLDRRFSAPARPAVR